jgi:hypothetical protein
MKPSAKNVGRALLAVLGVSSVGGCEVVRDVAEFCSQETIVVTTTADLRRPCSETECSAWGAVAAANTCSSGMTVVLPEGGHFSFGLRRPDSGPPRDETIFPAITGRLSIRGNGAELSRPRAAGVPPERFFTITPRGNLTISELTIRGGGGDDGPFYGGAFVNRGTLTLVDVQLMDNQSGVKGGAIHNEGRLHVRGGRQVGNRTFGCEEHGGGAIHNADRAIATVENVEFERNQGCGGAIHNMGRLAVTSSSFVENRGGSGDDNTFNHGGAILNETEGGPAVATIVGSTFTGNRAMIGAAIANWTEDPLIVRSSTLSGNVAHLPCPRCAAEDGPPRQTASAAIAYFGGAVELADVTIVRNTCEDALATCGGGIVVYSDRGSLSFSNTLIALHPDGDCRYAASLSSLPRLEFLGSNLDSDKSCRGFTIHRPPLLGPLADNGGPTRTHAVLPGSPALNAGTTCLAQDQRGEPRARSAEDPCDLGAFELQR